MDLSKISPNPNGEGPNDTSLSGEKLDHRWIKVESALFEVLVGRLGWLGL